MAAPERVTVEEVTEYVAEAVSFWSKMFNTSALLPPISDTLPWMFPRDNAVLADFASVLLRGRGRP